MVQMRKQHIFTHNRIYGKGVLDLGLVFFSFSFFSKNIIVFFQIGIMSCKMKIEMCIMAKYMLCPSAVYRLGRQFGSSLGVAIF